MLLQTIRKLTSTPRLTMEQMEILLGVRKASKVNSALQRLGIQSRSGMPQSLFKILEAFRTGGDGKTEKKQFEISPEDAAQLWKTTLDRFLIENDASRDGNGDIDKAEVDRAHYGRLRTGIETAIQRAPDGLPVACLGYGQGRDVPDAVFNFARFPFAVLLDGNEELVVESLKSRGLKSELDAGRIKVVQRDLNFLKSTIMQGIIQAVKGAASMQGARKKLLALYEEQENLLKIAKPVFALDGLGNLEGRLGFVSSSTYFPSGTGSIQSVIDRLIAEAFGKAAKVHVGDSRFAKDIEYVKAANSMYHAVSQAHTAFYRGLLQKNGMAYFAANILRISPLALAQAHEESPGIERVRRAVEVVIRHGFDPSLDPTLVLESTRFVDELEEAFYRDPQNYPFNNTLSTGYNLTSERAPWHEGFDIQSAKVWFWNSRPRSDSGHMVGALTMKRNGQSVPLKTSLATEAPMDDLLKNLPGNPLVFTGTVDELEKQLKDLGII